MPLAVLASKYKKGSLNSEPFTICLTQNRSLTLLEFQKNSFRSVV
ncbi:hypothetical protein F0Z19_1640 [Vibrio cyclitrophicus]|nr:hypothetical protein F0Z19_1640 [Vibrio cyclitrophicus]